MKKITLFLFAFCFLQFLAAQQAPGRFNYQAAVRNSSGDPLINQLVSLQISIADGSPNGASQYVERHTLSTNAFGLINLQIGAGQFQSGDFNAISWGQSPKWLKIDIDPTGGSNFSPLGVTELLSVPYALYAQQSADNSPTNELQTLSLNGTQLTLSNGGGTVNLPVGGGWTESSALSTTDQTKKVGIGVISPNQKLQVHDEGQSFTWVQLSHGASGATNGDGAFIGEIVSDLKIENCETGDVTLGTCINPNQLVVKNNGNVEIAGQLKIAGGSPGEGKVLTSDATGLASWQNAVGSTYTAGDGISIDNGTISTPWKISDEPGFSTLLQTKYPVQTSGLLVKQYNNWGASVNLFGLAGTSEAPAPVGLNSPLGNLYFGGSYGSGNTWNGGAWITCATAEDWSAPGSKTTAKLSFFTNEDGFYKLRMLINGNGQVGINSGNVSNLDAINSRFLANHRTNERGISIRNDDSGNYWSHSTGAGAGDLVLSFNGAIRGLFSSNNGVYSQGSDRSLKTDIQPWANPMLPALMKLRPATYRYKDNTPESPRSLGFIAQEVKEVFPEAVTAITDQTSGKEILAVAYDRFGILAIKAIQEQQAIIEAQQAEITELKARLADQEKGILSRLEKLESALKNR